VPREGKNSERDAPSIRYIQKWSVCELTLAEKDKNSHFFPDERDIKTQGAARIWGFYSLIYARAYNK
jgi:hypothetical protein